MPSPSMHVHIIASRTPTYYHQTKLLKLPFPRLHKQGRMFKLLRGQRRKSRRRQRRERRGRRRLLRRQPRRRRRRRRLQRGRRRRRRRSQPRRSRRPPPGRELSLLPHLPQRNYLSTSISERRTLPPTIASCKLLDWAKSRRRCLRMWMYHMRLFLVGWLSIQRETYFPTQLSCCRWQHV